METESNPLASPALNELAAALAKAQGAMSFARKDSQNPHFQSSYADLASIWDACRDPLAANGLSVSQPIGRDAAGGLCLKTILLHSSGQWLISEFPLLGDLTRPQVLGSLLTYARRYSLAAVVGIAQDDDDGNAAQQQAEQRTPARRSRPDSSTMTGPVGRPAPSRPPPPDYRPWIEAFVDDINRKWIGHLTGGGSAPAELVSIFQLNRHLLKFLSLGTWPGDEKANLKAGENAWRDNHEAMSAEAVSYCRKLWKDAAAKLKAKPAREPGVDDNMPSPDEEAALDQLATAK